jgi:hypothetical protein
VTAYDLDRIQRELANLTAPARNTTAKGRRLQDLVEYVVGQIPGVAIIDKNVLNAARSEEKDLWLSHTLGISQLPFRDCLVPIECKNEDGPASAAEVRDFATKIRDSGGCDGLLVAAAGLAGAQGSSAHHAIGVALSHGIRVTVLVVRDLAQLSCPDDLLHLLMERHTELRVLQCYRSI